MLNRLVAIFVAIQIILASGYGASQSSIVSVQSGEHPEFIRLSINWPSPVNFDFIQTANGYEVRFFRKVELLIDRVISIFPGSSYKHEADQTILTIRTNPNRNFVAKSYGNITYIDIYKDGSKQQTLVLQPAITPKKSNVEKQEEVVKKIPEVDLQNLFRKVADYLGELQPDLQSTVVSLGENGFLFKYSEPIATYELEGKVYVVILKDEYPVFEKQLEEKYAINLIKLNGAFAVQITPKAFTRSHVVKHKEGWQVEFSPTLPNGKAPQFFEREVDGKIRLNREGLLDPIDVEGVMVFCTQTPDVFAPFEFSYDGVKVLSTSAGAAFKLDSPEKLSLTREFIQISFNGGQLPQEQPNKINFDNVNLSKPFIKSKENLLSELTDDDKIDIKKHIELIYLYLAHTFASEAMAEINTLEKSSEENDDGLVGVLTGVASVLDEGKDPDVYRALFKLSKSDLEAAAWYGFLLAVQGNEHSLPSYLEAFLINGILGFPDPLRSLLLLKLQDVLISHGSIDAAETISNNISETQLSPDTLSLKQFLSFKIQRLKYGKKNKEEFKRLMQQSTNPAIAVRLITEGEMVDLKKKDHTQFITHLENIIPLLEGSPYHDQAIEYIFNYYHGLKNHFVSLEWAWAQKKRHKIAYGRIKSDVQAIILEIMRNDTLEKQGAIYALYLLDRFIEELPSTAYVSDYILDLTGKLHKIGLMEESIHLIENYMKREDVKLTLKKQQEMFFQLLDFYIKSENESKANDLMKMIEQRGELSKGDADKKDVFKARIALIKNNTDEALAALQTNRSKDGLKIKASLLWDQKNWSGAAEALEELIDKYGDELGQERRDRYIVHLAAALVLNEEKYPSKDLGRQKTRVSIQAVTKKYENVLSKYKELFSHLTTEPNNSFQQSLTSDIIKKELEETNQLEKLYDELKAVPTN